MHKCKVNGTCFKYSKDGECAICRFRFPKQMIECTYIDDQGKVHLKRDSRWVNNYHPLLLACLNCNIDIKQILIGEDCKGLIYYVTDYITK